MRIFLHIPFRGLLRPISLVEQQRPEDGPFQFFEVNIWHDKFPVVPIKHVKRVENPFVKHRSIPALLLVILNKATNRIASACFQCCQTR